MAAKFLCCLPLRLGVVVISFFQFLSCGAFAGIIWFSLISSQQNDLKTIVESMRTVAIIVAGIYTAAALVSVLGLLGALCRKNGFVKSFYVLLVAILSAQIGGSVWYLVTFYRHRSQTLAECINGSADEKRIAFCDSMDAYKRIPQAAMIVSVVVPILVQFYACYVVHQYSKRLEYQRANKIRAGQTFIPPSGSSYHPVMRSDEAHPLTMPVAQYPYADSPNSFGHQAQRSIGGNEATYKV